MTAVGDPRVTHEPSNLTLLATGKTDAEAAAELRNKLRPLLEQVVDVLNVASKSGLQINFQIGRDGFGRSVIAAMDVVRPL